MVKVVDMREALQQVREKAPNTADAMKRYKSGNAGFTDKAHLKAKGLIPRADGTKKVSPKYEGLNEISPDMRKFELEKQYKMILKDMPASERNTKAGKIKAMDLARVTATRAPGMTMRDLKILQKNKGTLKLEDLNQDEFIPEGMMKRLIGAVQDKLSKEGGAAGFADLAKAAKSMGVTLTKDMLKDMPGVKQHRDGDYILEELQEAFTKADFAKLEADNEHTKAAEKLINMFGTKEEKFAMAAIKARHNMTGYIKGPDYNKRQMMVNKYYSRLK